MNITHCGHSENPQGQRAPGISARVFSVYKDRYALACEHGELFARLKTSAYRGGAPLPAVGDFVLVELVPNGDGQITATLPRKTFFSRRSPSGHGEQAVAANFDFVFLLQSLNQNFNPKRLERYLALAWQSGALPVVLLTKEDLVEDSAVHVRAAERVAPGVEVLPLSAKTGAGLGALAPFLAPGKTAVLLGSSGVGKSSLINALAGQALLPTSEIREADGRGRHTTTRRQLIALPSGALLIDTPGMRELGMWELSSGLDGAFSDVERHLGHCKFSDCRHQTEPGCAVKAAIAAGELSPERWESYLSLQNEARYASGKADYLREKKQRGKEIAQLQKQMKQKPDYRHTPCEESFPCRVCGTLCSPQGAGTGHRNHCPSCLSSLHVDHEPGDRASLCRGVMEPIGVWVRKNGEWALIHRCKACGALSSNRVAADDNPALLLSIAVKPLAAPPFPLSTLSNA